MADTAGRTEPGSNPTDSSNPTEFEPLRSSVPGDIIDVALADEFASIDGSADADAAEANLDLDGSGPLPIRFDDSAMPDGSPTGSSLPDTSPTTSPETAGNGSTAPHSPDAPRGPGVPGHQTPPGPVPPHSTGPDPTPAKDHGPEPSRSSRPPSPAPTNRPSPAPTADQAPDRPGPDAAADPVGAAHPHPGAPGPESGPTNADPPGHRPTPAPRPDRPASAKSAQGALAAGEQALKRRAAAALTSGASELPGLNKLADKAMNVAFDKTAGRAVFIAKAAGGLVAFLVLAILVSTGGLASIGSLLNSQGFDLPGSPTDTERVLMPPGHDPVTRPPVATTVDDMLKNQVAFSGYNNQQPVKQPEVPGWADVLYGAQDSTADDSFGVPWTVLAGIVRSQSDFGRTSPYDAIDRNPRRDLAYGLPPDAEGSAGVTDNTASFTGTVLLAGSALLRATSAQLAGAVPNSVSTDTYSTLADVGAALKARATLPGAVVIYAGPAETSASAAAFPTTIKRLMSTLTQDTTVYGVTYWDPTRPALSTTINNAWAAAARAHANLRVVGWAKQAKGSPKWFDPAGSPTAAATSALGRLLITTISDTTSSAGWVPPIKKGQYTAGAYFGQAGSTGQDFVAAAGTPVYAVRAGTVTAKPSPTGGPDFVEISHGKVGNNTVSTTYGAMSKKFVHTGEVVKAGQKIGVVGSAGSGSGPASSPHLHLEVLLNGTTPVDPGKYIAFTSTPPVSPSAGAGTSAPLSIHDAASGTSSLVVDRVEPRSESASSTQVDSAGQSCAVPTLNVPIGGGKDQGVGPFLLMPEQAAALKSSGGDPQNPCDAATFVATKLTAVGASLYESGDYDGWEDSDAVAKKLWSDTIAASGLFADPTAAGTDCTAVIDGNSSVGAAIETIWTCEALRTEGLQVVTSATKDAKGHVSFETVNGATAASYLVSEAQAVAYNYSKYKVKGCDSSSALAGIFPLSAKVARRYGATDRCDPVQNIRAAAQAVLAGEAVPVSARPSTQGPYEPMLGGWRTIGWALGSDAALFSRTGPAVSWSSTPACDAVAVGWLNTIQTGLSVDLDTLTPDLTATESDQLRTKIAALGSPDLSTACAGATAQEWNETLTSLAADTDSASTGADTATVARYQVLTAFFATESEQTVSTPKAIAGKNSMVDRLSPVERQIDPGPGSGAVLGLGDGLPMAAKAIEYAVGYGGIRPDWSTASASVLDMATLGAGVGFDGGVISGDVATVIAAAKSELGVPYAWGGGTAAGPSRGVAQGAGTIGFDCSGLALYAYAKVGISLPHLSTAQSQMGTAVNGLSNALPGDLIFWPGHVAMYLGNGQVIHAPHTGDVVKIVPIAWAHTGSPTAIRRFIQPSASVSSTNYPAATSSAKALAARLQGVGGAGYAGLFDTAGKQYNLDPALLAGIAMQESGFSPGNIECQNRSSAGAEGIMQFMPSTAAGMGIDPCDPSSAIFGAAKYVRGLLNNFGGNLDKALGAYNWGSGNVIRYGLGAAPAETRNYVREVPQHCRDFGGCRAT